MDSTEPMVKQNVCKEAPVGVKQACDQDDTVALDRAITICSGGFSSRQPCSNPPTKE